MKTVFGVLGPKSWFWVLGVQKRIGKCQFFVSCGQKKKCGSARLGWFCLLNYLHWRGPNSEADTSGPKLRPKVSTGLSGTCWSCFLCKTFNVMNGGEGTRNIRSCNRAGGIIYSSPYPLHIAGQVVPATSEAWTEPAVPFIPSPPPPFWIKNLRVRTQGDPQHPKHQPSRRHQFSLSARGGGAVPRGAAVVEGTVVTSLG
jgi:hypothetical protein